MGNLTLNLDLLRDEGVFEFLELLHVDCALSEGRIEAIYTRAQVANRRFEGVGPCLLPVRKGEAAIAAYVGKYLEGGLVIRKHSWKGCRRVELDRRAKHDWLACSRGFAWHSDGAVEWRKRVGELGAALGVQDLDGIKRKLGPKWAYRMRETITTATDEDWQLVLRCLAPDRTRSLSRVET